MSLITVIGRGHSGTRAMSHTLVASGVFMGEPLNKSGDLLPPQAMYDACRVLARHVRWLGGLDWDWSALHSMDIPAEFTTLINTYLKSVLAGTETHRGWKIPETTLVFPWIVRMFPDAKYICWMRDPRDCILGRHLTDNLNDFGIEYPATDDARRRRAISWIYQYKLVEATPKPANWLVVRFEDFVRKQNKTLRQLEEFLGIPMAKIIVKPETVGRWKTAEGEMPYDILQPALEQYGYVRGKE